MVLPSLLVLAIGLSTTEPQLSSAVVVAECYELSVDGWPPTPESWLDRREGHRMTNDPPPYFHLTRQPAGDQFPDWYRGWPPLTEVDQPVTVEEEMPAPPLWKPVAGDSIVVVWPQSLIGYELRLSREDTVLRGTVRAFARPLMRDYPWTQREEHGEPLIEEHGVAVPIPCERFVTPPPPAKDSLEIVRAVAADLRAQREGPAHVFTRLACNNLVDCESSDVHPRSSRVGGDWLVGVFMNELGARPYVRGQEFESPLFYLYVPVIHTDSAHVWVDRLLSGERQTMRGTVSRRGDRWEVTVPLRVVHRRRVGLRIP
jgi:hypothetical protein